MAKATEKKVVDNIDEIKEQVAPTEEAVVEEEQAETRKAFKPLVTIKKNAPAFITGAVVGGAVVGGVIAYKNGLWPFDKKEEVTEE